MNSHSDKCSFLQEKKKIGAISPRESSGKAGKNKNAQTHCGMKYPQIKL